MRTPTRQGSTFRLQGVPTLLTPVEEESSLVQPTTEPPAKRRRLALEEETKGGLEFVRAFPPSAGEAHAILPSDQQSEVPTKRLGLRAFLRAEEEAELGPDGMLAWKLQR